MLLALFISSNEVAETSKRNLVHHDGDDNVIEHVCKRTKSVPGDTDRVSIVLESVSPLLVDNIIYERLTTRSEYGRYKASIGSTEVVKGSQYIEEEIIDTGTDNLSTQKDDGDMISLDSYGNTDFLSEEELMDRVQARIIKGNNELDKIMARATHARKSREIDAYHLSEVCKLIWTLRDEPLKLNHKTAAVPMIPSCPKTMVQMTTCCNIQESRIGFYKYLLCN